MKKSSFHVLFTLLGIAAMVEGCCLFKKKKNRQGINKIVFPKEEMSLQVINSTPIASAKTNINQKKGDHEEEQGVKVAIQNSESFPPSNEQPILVPLFVKDSNGVTSVFLESPTKNLRFSPKFSDKEDSLIMDKKDQKENKHKLPLSKDDFKKAVSEKEDTKEAAIFVLVHEAPDCKQLWDAMDSVDFKQETFMKAYLALPRAARLKCIAQKNQDLEFLKAKKPIFTSIEDNKVIFADLVESYQDIKDNLAQILLQNTPLGSKGVLEAYIRDHCNNLQVGQWEWLLNDVLSEEQKLTVIREACSKLLDPDVLLPPTIAIRSDEVHSKIQSHLQQRANDYYEMLEVLNCGGDNFLPRMLREARYVDWKHFEDVEKILCKYKPVIIFTNLLNSISIANARIKLSETDLKLPIIQTQGNGDTSNPPVDHDKKYSHSSLLEASALLGRLIAEGQWEELTSASLLADASYLAVAQAYKSCHKQTIRKLMLQKMPSKVLDYMEFVMFPGASSKKPAHLEKSIVDGGAVSVYRHNPAFQDHFEDFRMHLLAVKTQSGNSCCCTIL